MTFHISDLSGRMPAGFDFVTAVDPANPTFDQTLPMTGPVMTTGAPRLIRTCDVRLDSSDPSQVEQWEEMVEGTGLCRLLTMDD